MHWLAWIHSLHSRIVYHGLASTTKNTVLVILNPTVSSAMRKPNAGVLLLVKLDMVRLVSFRSLKLFPSLLTVLYGITFNTAPSSMSTWLMGLRLI